MSWTKTFGKSGLYVVLRRCGGEAVVLRRESIPCRQVWRSGYGIQAVEGLGALHRCWQGGVDLKRATLFAFSPRGFRRQWRSARPLESYPDRTDNRPDKTAPTSSRLAGSGSGPEPLPALDKSAIRQNARDALGPYRHRAQS